MQAGNEDLEVLIRSGVRDPFAIGLAKNLFEEAGIPFFTMDETPSARRDVESLSGWWTVRVPRDREAEAREILRSIEEAK
jgi:hypothetical protein